MLITVNKVLTNVSDSTYVKPWSEMVSNGNKYTISFWEYYDEIIHIVNFSVIATYVQLTH